MTNAPRNLTHEPASSPVCEPAVCGLGRYGSEGHTSFTKVGAYPDELSLPRATQGTSRLRGKVWVSHLGLRGRVRATTSAIDG